MRIRENTLSVIVLVLLKQLHEKPFWYSILLMKRCFLSLYIYVSQEETLRVNQESWWCWSRFASEESKVRASCLMVSYHAVERFFSPSCPCFSVCNQSNRGSEGTLGESENTSHMPWHTQAKENIVLILVKVCRSEIQNPLFHSLIPSLCVLSVKRKTRVRQSFPFVELVYLLCCRA